MLAIAAIAGAGTMVVELAAVRLLAPWFGTSLVVWTNVIAVILLALSLGYLIGGRLATRLSPLNVLCWMLLSASLLVAWAPLLGASISRGMLPEVMALNQAADLVRWGSLAVALLVFLPPAALLGTVCPLVVEILARTRRIPAGSAGGAVLFVSTLGSLLGVFGTSHLLLPAIGLQRTFLLASAALFLAGLLAGWLAHGRAVGTTGSLAVSIAGLSAALFSPTRPALPAGRVELARRESAYQALRVVEDRNGPGPLRLLLVNEGFDSFQSVWQARLGCLPEGFYYNDFLLPMLWSAPTAHWRVLVLGLGAGTVVRVFAGEKQREARFVGVELDPSVVELGREFFDLEPNDENLTVVGGVDARVALRVERGPFEQIVLDCYSNQVEIPAHLCTLEFFLEAYSRLSEGGWLTANLGGFDFDDPVVAAVARTCARSFGAPVLLVRVPRARNYMLVARRGELPFIGGLLLDATQSSQLALGPRQLPGFTRWVQPDEPGPSLTDDCCPIETLQFRSIAEARVRRLATHDS